MSHELAVVVISLRAQEGVSEAVRSLQEQDAACELVVVNSGGGNVASRLRDAGLATPVHEIAAAVYPGAARNAGIAATRAPFVAFLAADCRALPGWVAARVAAHADGAAVVASAVVNPYRRNACSWATQALLFSRRMPGVPAPQALLYGCSYDRAVLERYGPFRTDLRAGEDTELHRRLPGGVAVRWCPEVRTAHGHPRTLPALLADQFGRGRRAARAWAELIDASGELALFQRPQLDILSYFPARGSLSEIDRASAHVLNTGMRLPPAQSLFVATYTVDGASLTARGHQVAADVASGRILRSVLMKPETEQYVPALHQQVLGLLAGF